MPASFSANGHGDIWPFVAYGFTREEKRLNLRGEFVLLDDLADIFISERPEGGRFFVDQRGCFFRPEGAEPRQFALFTFVEGEAKRTEIKRRSSTTFEFPAQRLRRLHNEGICDHDSCPHCEEEAHQLRIQKESRSAEAMADYILGVGQKKRWER